MILGIRKREIALRSLIIIFLLALLGIVYYITAKGANTETMTTQTNKDIMYGVTIDRINHLDQTISALGRLPTRLTSRIVFDENIQPQTYTEAVSRLRQDTDLMGNLLDSLYIKDYSVDRYAQRARDYVQSFHNDIAIWEVGNEINGEWLLNRNEPRSLVVDKLKSAYDTVRQYGGKTAITLYYNEGCWDIPEHEMFRWVRSELPVSLKQNIDYVLVSHYEDACPNIKPNWQQVFERLRAEFPYAKLGFGEVGLEDQNASEADKEASLRRYYAIRPDVEGFIGGYFWWYFWDDMVGPMSRGDTTMIDALADIIQP